MRIFTNFTFSGKLVLSFLLFYAVMLPNGFSQFGNEFRVTTGFTAQELVDELIGDGIQTSNAVITGPSIAIGKFTGESNLNIASGVVITTGKAINAVGPNNNAAIAYASPPAQNDGDPDLKMLAGNVHPSHDACVLEFDFVPESDKVEFRYVFGSDEYMEYVSGNYNDVFGFFISPAPLPGPYTNGAVNIARLPILGGPEVSIHNVNANTNSQFYLDNTGGTSIQYDGFTVVLTATATVVPCNTYHIKLAISDIYDETVDSGVFLESNSFSSVGLAANVGFTYMQVDTAVEGCNSASVTFQLASPTSSGYPIHFEEIGGTATNGEDYEEILPDLFIPVGQTTAILNIIPYEDGTPEDDTETVTLTYNSSICGVDMETLTVYIKDLAPFSSSATQGQDIYCRDTITLVASGDGGQVPYFYEWLPNGETNDSLIVSPDSTTTYTVKVRDICGQGQADQHDILITVLPPEVAITEETFLCSGTTMFPDLTGGAIWLWSSDPPDPMLVGHETEQNPEIGPTVYTEYTVIASDSCGNDVTKILKVTVDQLTANAGADDLICKGSSYILSANNVPNVTYTWSANPPDPSLAGHENEREPEVSPTVTTVYTVVMENTCGNTSNDDVEIQVMDMTVNANIDKPEICFGETVTLTASSNPAGTFLWKDQDGKTVGSGALLTLQPDTEATYTVTATAGCVMDGNPVSVVVHPLPAVSASASSTRICPDDNVQLTGTGAVSYVWTSIPVDNTLTLQNTLATPLVTPAADTKYMLEGTDVYGCKNTTDINITIKPRMYADFSAAAPSVCQGDELVITYDGNATPDAQFDWDFGGSTYTSQLEGPHAVSWNTEGLKTITLVVTEESCVSAPFTLDILVNPTPVSDFSSDIDKACIPANVQFTNLASNTIGTSAYEWTFSGVGTSSDKDPSFTFLNPGTYDVSLTVRNGNCSNTRSVSQMIEAWPLPVASHDANPEKATMKNPVVTFTGTSGDNMQYSWETGDGSVYNDKSFTHTYALEGFYNAVLEVTNEYGCVDTEEFVFEVTPKYMIQIPNAFTPNGDGVNDKLIVSGKGVKEIRFTIHNKWGSQVRSYHYINPGSDAFTEFEIWAPVKEDKDALFGTYVYRVFFMDLNGETMEETGSFVLFR